MGSSDTDLLASDVAWDLDPLLDGADGPLELLDRADRLAADLRAHRGRVASLDSDGLVELMTTLAELSSLVSRAGHFTSLRFSEDTSDPAVAAAMQTVNERSTAISTSLLFIDLEWADTDDAHAAAVLDDERLAFCRHHLENLRRYRPHQLSEPEETVLSKTSLSGPAAWVRLFEEQTSAIEVDLPEAMGGTVGLMTALAQLQHPEPEVRESSAAAVPSVRRID